MCRIDLDMFNCSQIELILPLALILTWSYNLEFLPQQLIFSHNQYLRHLNKISQSLNPSSTKKKPLLTILHYNHNLKTTIIIPFNTNQDVQNNQKTIFEPLFKNPKSKTRQDCNPNYQEIPKIKKVNWNWKMKKESQRERSYKA